MSMRGIDAPASQLETTAPKAVDHLGPLLRKAALACALVMGGSAQARDPTSPHFTAIEKAIDKHARLLNKSSFEQRERAMQQLIHETRTTLSSMENPLPSDFFDELELKAEISSAEVRARLITLESYIRFQQQKDGGRIPCPKALARPVHELMEQQFFTPIWADDPQVNESLMEFNEAKGGDKSMDVLMRMCEKYGRVPELTQKGIVLREANGEVVRANDRLIMVEKRTPNGVEKTIFHAPDKGAILGESNDAKCDITVARGESMDWRVPTYYQRFPNRHLKSIDEGRAIQTLVARHPSIQEISLRNAETTIGPQRFRLLDCEQEHTGTWLVRIDGGSYESVRWNDTSGSQDEIIYQQTAATRFAVYGEDGRRIPCTVRSMTVHCRTFMIHLECPKEPAKIHIRGFADVATERIELP